MMPTTGSYARQWRHTHSETDSAVAERLLADWDAALGTFTKVMPNDYQRVLNATARAEREGLDVTETIMAASQK